MRRPFAWGRPADADALFALTREGSSSPELERLAEAFGMMIVKVEAREFQRAELLEKVEQPLPGAGEKPPAPARG